MGERRAGVASMPAEEVKAIRFFEHILAPILVAVIIAVIIGGVSLQRAVAQMEVRQGADKETIDDLKKSIDQARQSVDNTGETLSEVQLKVNSLEATQQYLADDVRDLKGSNKEILQLLREIRDGGRAR